MGTLRITTWNVLADRYLRPRHYPHLGRFDGPEGRAAAQCSLAAGCDVLALQEVEAHLASAAAEHLGDGWGTLWQQRGNSRADGTFLAVRHDHPHHLTGHTHPCGDLAWVTATLELDRSQLCVAATHLAWSDQPARTHPAVEQVTVAATVDGGP